MQADYVDHMGDDLRVVNAARVSFDKESEYFGDTGDGELLPESVIEERFSYDFMYEGGFLCGKDTKLIHYLADHGHWTPFSHPQITMRETAPIFVARQRFKHMVGFTYNEVSRRYVDDEPAFYVPEGWRKRADNKKQGSEGTLIEDNSFFMKDYEEYLKNAGETYESLLVAGVAPEQARMILPQSMYTSYYVTGSLAAWARAYKQRSDSHAQKEIQDLAKMWAEVIEPLFPVSWDALTNE